MAGELGPVDAPTGKFVYAVIHRGSAATVRDVVAGAWDTLTDADIADYDVQLTEQGTASGSYRGDAPSGLNLTSEGHIAKLYYRNDSSVAIGDTFLGSQRIGLTEANLAALGNDAQSATDLKDFADSGYDPATNKVEAVKTADATTLVNGLANDVITTDSIDDGAIGVNQIGDGAITAAKIANGAIDAATFAADVDAEFLSYIVDDATRIDASALNTATGTTIPAILDDTDLIDDGTSGLAKIATDVAAALVDTDAVEQRLTATRAGYLDNLSAGAVATASKLLKYIRLLVRKDSGATIDDITELNEINANSGNGAGVYSNGTDSQEALRDRGDASWITVPAASIRSAIGMSSANLDTQLGGIDDKIDTAQADLDVLTGADGATLATLQPNYAPATETALTTLSNTVGVAGAGLTEAGGTGDQLTGIPFTGLATSSNVAVILDRMLGYAQVLARSDSVLLTERSDEIDDINFDFGGGAGNYDPTTDSQEAMRDRGDAAYGTATGFSTHSATDVWAAGTRTLTDKTGFALTTAYDVYHADIKLNVDEANSQDEYTITWFKNGVPVTSGITSPTLQVVKRADGTDLIASTTPTQIASTGSYKHDATTTARMTAGQDALVIVTATIDAATRTFYTLVGRDSSA